MEVAQEVVVPRFRDLESGDIEEKAPADYVTVVDHAVEARLAAQLPSLQHGSRCIGEEACHRDLSLHASLDRGWVWLIDPIDGTTNLVRGDSNFAIMVALLRDGECVASWMNAPVAGWRTASEQGSGSTIDGRDATIEDRSALAPGVIYSRFVPASAAGCVERFRSGHPNASGGSGSAGCDYYSLVSGDIGFGLFWRTLSWDHAAGSFFVNEAGGRVARLNGDVYRPTETDRRGLLAAPLHTWQALASELESCFENET